MFRKVKVRVGVAQDEKKKMHRIIVVVKDLPMMIIRTMMSQKSFILRWFCVAKCIEEREFRWLLLLFQTNKVREAGGVTRSALLARCGGRWWGTVESESFHVPLDSVWKDGVERKLSSSFESLFFSFTNQPRPVIIVKEFMEQNRIVAKNQPTVTALRKRPDQSKGVFIFFPFCTTNKKRRIKCIIQSITRRIILRLLAPSRAGSINFADHTTVTLFFSSSSPKIWEKNYLVWWNTNEIAYSGLTEEKENALTRHLKKLRSDKSFDSSPTLHRFVFSEPWRSSCGSRWPSAHFGRVKNRPGKRKNRARN